MASKQIYLGELLAQIGERNKEMLSSEPLGVSIDKEFMPSVANTIGTDLSKYMLLRKNYFACNPMHVGRDRALPIARYKKSDPGIVSPAYFTFVVDESKVDLDYLELFFKLDVFDRECWFYTDSTVRGGLSWDALCGISLNIPSREEQKKIASISRLISKRTASLAEQNDYLTQMGIAIVSEMTAGKSLVGLSPALAAEVGLPKGLTAQRIGDFCTSMGAGSTPSRSDKRFWDNASVPWVKSGEVCGSSINATEEAISTVALEETSVRLFKPGTILIAMYGVTAGQVGYLDIEATTNQAVCGMICESPDKAAFLYFTLLRNQDEIARLANGGAQSNLSKKVISDISIPIPSVEALSSSPLNCLLDNIAANGREILYLTELRDTLLPKLMSGEIDVSKVDVTQLNNHLDEER